jgi:glucose-1-phosphate thymidylyltransferase
VQGVILAAGRGTRLRPITDGRSKAMVPVLRQPLVERAVTPLVAAGVRDLIVVISPDDREIRAHFEGRRTDGAHIQLIVQEQQLGTAHALAIVAPMIRGRFALWACDSLVSEGHVRELVEVPGDADAVLSVLEAQPGQAVSSAVVRTRGSWIFEIVEKPARRSLHGPVTISLPHYVFTPGLLPFLTDVPASKRGELELQDAVQRWLEAGARMRAVRAPGRLQVSTADELLELNRLLLRRQPDGRASVLGAVEETVCVIPPVRIEEGAAVGSGTVVGPESYLESGCRIGDHAMVRRSVVLRGARVGDGELVEDRIVSVRSGSP